MEKLETKDHKLWKQAKRRVEFKKHATAYLLVNCFLIGIWLVTGLQHEGFNYFWPAFPMLGWGIGLAFHYNNAYGQGADAVEKEYEKLKNEKS